MLVAVPTLITFLISGLWHGAGWNFVWGAPWPDAGCEPCLAGPETYQIGPEIGRWFRPLGVALTFLCVAVTLIVFQGQ